MNDVVKLYPSNAAENPDAVLEQAVGNFSEVLILGWDKNDTLDVRATLSLSDGGDLLWLIETFKSKLLNGDYGGVDP